MGLFNRFLSGLIEIDFDKQTLVFVEQNEKAL